LSRKTGVFYNNYKQFPKFKKVQKNFGGKIFFSKKCHVIKKNKNKKNKKKIKKNKKKIKKNKKK